jgi:CO/xanthine dehydrogenase FAD-binding subunit
MPAEASLWRASADDTLQLVLDRADAPGLLVQALKAIPWQSRSLARLGRVATTPALAPQVAAALLALDARVVTDPSSEQAELAIEAFLGSGLGSSPSEIRLPLAEFLWGSCRVARTPADSPIVSAYACIALGTSHKEIDQARIALTGAWPEPARLAASAGRLSGRTLSDETIAATAAAVAEECRPVGDYLGSEEYRQAMAGVVSARALRSCAEQMRAGAERAA